MTFFDDTSNNRSMTDFTHAVSSRMRGMFDTPFDQRSRRISRRIAQLRSLSDPQLAELGLSRSDIIPYVFSAYRNR